MAPSLGVGPKLEGSVQFCTDATDRRVHELGQCGSFEDGARGDGELPMNDAQRYRMNAAECILAGERCGLAYRDLTFALAESWLSLARQQEAMDELLAIWSEARHAPSTVVKRQPFQCSPDRHLLTLPAPPCSDAAGERAGPMVVSI
jgi:hypothetical protein